MPLATIHTTKPSAGTSSLIKVNLIVPPSTSPAHKTTLTSTPTAAI